jgi:HTH-type transcriptional regulator/antitoxin HipB
MHNILQEIKARRKELGMTQAEMAKKLKISQPQYQKIESGGNPSLKTLSAMAMALNMRIVLVPKEKSVDVEEIIHAKGLTGKPLSLGELYKVNDE